MGRKYVFAITVFTCLMLMGKFLLANATENLVDLTRLGSDWTKASEVEFKRKYPKRVKPPYILSGRLEIVDLGQIKVYGLRQGENAIIISQADQTDYWYPTLRANVGKEIVLGVDSFSGARFQNTSWERQMSSKGYFYKGDRFLATQIPLIYGMKPKPEIDPDQNYDSFISAVDKMRIERGNDKEEVLVDPDKLPKGQLTMVIITPVTAVFSTGTRTFQVKIEGPIVKTFTKEKVAAAHPVQVDFTNIPQGKYRVTAQYGAAQLVKDIQVEGRTEVLDMVMQ